MAVRLFRVIVPVGDIERAAGFYAVVLGAAGVRVSAGRHYFDCGGTILACYDPRADGDDGPPRPNAEWLYLSVPDLEGTYEACRRAGASFSHEDVHGEPGGRIATRPWGERSFYVEDPFGNKLCFVERGTEFVGRD